MPTVVAVTKAIVEAIMPTLETITYSIVPAFEAIIIAPAAILGLVSECGHGTNKAAISATAASPKFTFSLLILSTPRRFSLSYFVSWSKSRWKRSSELIPKPTKSAQQERKGVPHRTQGPCQQYSRLAGQS